MSQKQDSMAQQVRPRTVSLLARTFNKRITWFSIAMALVLLFAAALVSIQQNPTYAASAKHGISAPKHVPSKPHPHQPPKSGTTLNVSPLALSFTVSLAKPLTPTQTFNIKNSGVSPLIWHTSGSVASWVSSVVPAKGTIASSLTISVSVTVKPTQLAVGTYTTQLLLIGTDHEGLAAVGSPQTLTITLTITA